MENKTEDIKIIAIVKFNDGEAYVINRKPKYIYTKEFIKGNRLLYAVDGPFISCLKYDPPSPGFVAFAGRKFDLPLIGGGVEKCRGQWWDGGIGILAGAMGTEINHVTLGTIEKLKRCYVFYGTCMEKKAMDKMRSEYKGQVYNYREYEKIIKYDDMRSDFWKREDKLKRDKKNLIKEIKKKHKIIMDGIKHENRIKLNHRQL
jgi:hypothetical protein